MMTPHQIRELHAEALRRARRDTIIASAILSIVMIVLIGLAIAQDCGVFP